MKYDWTRIKSDVNGNPRYVIHFLNLLTEEEKFEHEGLEHTWKYALACKRANKIGGRKYHNKSYGGGIVFSSYALEDEERAIDQLLEEARKTEAPQLTQLGELYRTTKKG